MKLNWTTPNLVLSSACLFFNAAFLGCFSVNAAETMQVVESSPWEFGIGVGSGERDNIIVDSGDININAFVHIAYFGERFFFDNGDVGYLLTDNEHWNINLIAGVNSERQFFENFNRFGFGAGEQLSPSTGVDGDMPVRSTSRDTPLDGGLEFVGDGDWGSLQFQLNTDISDKHNGYEVWSGYSYDLSFGQLNLTPSVGFIYKSDKWTDYFYGVRPNEVIIDPDDGNFIRPPYTANSAVNDFFRLTMSYRLSDNWRVIGVIESENLDDTIRNSPIVDGDKITTHFLGMYYQF